MRFDFLRRSFWNCTVARFAGPIARSWVDVLRKHGVEVRFWCPPFGACLEIPPTVSTPSLRKALPALAGSETASKLDVVVHRNPREHGFGGARKAAESMGVDFLGEIPLDMAIREGSDGGRPIVIADPDSPHAVAYRAIADRISEKIESARAAAPRIVVQ